MSLLAPTPKDNHPLAALPPDVYARLLPDLEFVELPLAAVLHESNSALSHIYFPTAGIVSMLQAMASGVCAEIAVVGSEGLVGASLFMDGDSTPNRAVVQCAGQGFRIRAQPLRAELDRAGSVMDMLLRHAQALITQMVQTAACNRHHSLQQQFCRWLLLSLDRLPSSGMVIGQETVATMLGVSVERTVALARQLSTDGLLRYQAGRIEVSDRAAVETRACECYAVLKKELSRLLPHTTSD
jgi:CRP-like cAMP-binding protein